MSVTGTNTIVPNSIVPRRQALSILPPDQIISPFESDGSCWSCVSRQTPCDKGLPYCVTCLRDGIECEGYGTRLHWKATVDDSDRTSATSSFGNDTMRGRMRLNDGFVYARRRSSVFNTYIPEDPIIAASTTKLERQYLRHFLTHVCRVTYAIDNESNGLRNTILPMSAGDVGLRNSILAVASQHRGTWEKRTDPQNQAFFTAAIANLRKNLNDKTAVTKQENIATIFVLVMHEVFNASTGRWRDHLRGAADLIRFRGGSSDIHPVIKRNLYMLDLQSALNCGDDFFFESEKWMEDELKAKKKELNARPEWPVCAIESPRREACVIDSLLGSSVQVLYILAKTAKLYVFSRKPVPTGLNLRAEILQKGNILAKQLHALSLKDVPISSIIIYDTSVPLSSTPPVTDPEVLEEAIATAEIIRNCAIIYLFRVMHGDTIPLDDRTNEALEEAFLLLPKVPDVFGPGSILGWSITVMGCEVPKEKEEEREYLRCRWNGIHGLGLKHSYKGAELLEEVWRRRDRADETAGPPYPRFQDVSRDLGWQLVLI